MNIIYCGTTYECSVAIKCENDKYIKLYDENGVEIVSFTNISDFSEYEISGGSFTNPCECSNPILLTTYVVKGCTISPSSWTLDSSNNMYYYEIENNLFSGNEKTCNILLFFEDVTKLQYEATQEDGKITLFTNAAPLVDIVIDSIQITKP